MVKKQHWRVGKSYWKGKKKDKYTIQRLSESKFKKVVQYNLNGDLIKIWASQKEVGLTIFNDYKLDKSGGASSKIYEILSNKTFKGRTNQNSIWVKESELKQHLGKIPNKIQFNQLNWLQRKPTTHKPPTYKTVYSVEQYDLEGNFLKTFNCVQQVVKIYNTNCKRIQTACRKNHKTLGYYWKYGEKIKIVCDKNGKLVPNKIKK